MTDCLDRLVSKLDEYKIMLVKARTCMAHGPYVWGTTREGPYIKALKELAAIFGFSKLVRREREEEGKAAVVFEGFSHTCGLFDNTLNQHNWGYDSVLSFIFEKTFPGDVYLAEIVNNRELRVCFCKHVTCVHTYALRVPCLTNNKRVAKRQKIRALGNVLKQAQYQITELERN